MQLDDFIIDQPIVHKMLVNAVVKKRFSHAYLIEGNGYEKKEKLALAFAKYLICPEHHRSLESSKNCNFCQRVDSGNFTEIKIIEPDGLWIKKEQLVDLQKEFNRKAIEGNKKIYIINSADRLNAASANSILKFLEEPEDNIVAILVCNNSFNILDTVKSRCQVISLLGNEKTNSFKDEQEEKLSNLAVEFVNYFEQNKLDTILYFDKKFAMSLETRDNYLIFLNYAMLYYKDILNNKIGNRTELFENNIESIIKVANRNTVDIICNKIYIILEAIESVKGNINNSLMMDKLIISLDRGN